MTNPICLLTKGRTFKDMADRSGEYKVLSGNSLPKFGSSKRFHRRDADIHEESQTSLFEQPPVAEQATVVEAPKSVTPPVEPPETAQPASSSKSPFSEAAPSNPTSSKRGTWKIAMDHSKELVKRLILWPKGRPTHRAGVQAELALEKVTVLRNDLNEDDLEVVLVERKVGTGEKPLARLSKVEMTGEAWLKLTAPFRKKSNESANNPKAEAKPAPELGARA